MKTTFEVDPAILVAEINQLEKIASVQIEFDSDVTSYKFKSTDVRAMALEIKDFLGRTEYNAIRVHKIIVTPESVAEPGEFFFAADGAVQAYKPGERVKGFTLLQCILEMTP